MLPLCVTGFEKKMNRECGVAGLINRNFWIKLILHEEEN